MRAEQSVCIFYNISPQAKDFVLVKLFEALVSFGSTIYSRATLYKCQSFLKGVVLLLIIFNQCCTATNEIQVTVIYSRAILVAVTSTCGTKRVICKNQGPLVQS